MPTPFSFLLVSVPMGPCLALALLALLSHPAPFTGPEVLSVRGRVVDARGSPVEGAAVWAGPITTAADHGWLVIPFESRLRPPEAMATCATTDADGAFVVEFVRSARVHLAIRCAGFATRDTLYDVPEPWRELDVGVVTLCTGVTLRGRVVDEDGVPIASAELLRRGRQRLSHDEELGWEGVVVATTGLDGTFQVDTLASARTELEVSAPGFVPQRRTIGPEQLASREWGLVLERAAPITGRVVGVPEGSDVFVAFFDPARAEMRRVPCAPRGGFVLDGLSPRGAPVSLAAQGRRSTSRTGPKVGNGFRFASPHVTVRPGEQGVVLRVPEPVVYRLRVVDAWTWSTLANVRLGLLDGTDLEFPFDEGWSEAGGVLSVTLRRPTGHEGRAISVAAPGHERVAIGELPFRPGAIVDLGVVPLERLPGTQVRLVDDQGRAVEGARVTATIDRGEDDCFYAHVVSRWEVRRALPDTWQGWSEPDGSVTAFLSRGSTYWIHVEDPRYEEFWQRVETRWAPPGSLELRLVPR